MLLLNYLICNKEKKWLDNCFAFNLQIIDLYLSCLVCILFFICIFYISITFKIFIFSLRNEFFLVFKLF